MKHVLPLVVAALLSVSAAAQTASDYRAEAEAGNAESQYNLGVCYDNGYGVVKNYAEAVKWYRLAAEQGYAEAQYNLGTCYDNGDGVIQDYAEAAKWYRLAAEQGYAEAQYNLGACYHFGNGVEMDKNAALYWYERAVENGISDSFMNTLAESTISILKDEGYSSSKAKITPEVNASTFAASLGVDYRNILFSDVGGNKTISVTTKADAWDVFDVPSWLAINKSENNSSFTITCFPNLERNRSAVIWVESGENEVSINVRQEKPATHLTIDRKNMQFRNIGQAYSANVSTDAEEWMVSDAPEWCSVSMDGDRLVVTCGVNNGGTRSGRIKITANPETEYINVSQTAAATFLTSEISEIIFTDAGGEKIIQFDSDADSWRVSSPWWCLAKAEDHKLTIWCEANKDGMPKDGQIKITSGRQELNIAIRQKAAFNAPKGSPRPLGVSIGYVNKQWAWTTKGESAQKYGAWDVPDSSLGGIQAGVRFEPLFKYGLGLSTGLFYERYQSTSDKYVGEYYEGGNYDYTMNYTEHSLYLPLHLEYRANLTEQFSLFAEAGVGFDYGLGAKITATEVGDDAPYYTETDVYGNSDLGFPNKRLNASFEMGAGLRYNGLQLNVGTSKGMINFSDDANMTVKQNKPVMVSLSWMIPQDGASLNMFGDDTWDRFYDLEKQGVSFGYVSKQWEWIDDNYVEKFGLFDSKVVNGISMGYTYNHFLGYGFEFGTGLSLECYFGFSDKYYDDYGDTYTLMYNEASLNLPLHLQYRLMLSDHYSIYAQAGPSFDMGLYAGYDVKYGEETAETIGGLYGNTDEGFYNKRFVPYIDYGLGVRRKNVQFGIKFSRGLSDFKGENYKVKQNKNLMLSLSWMFQ